MNGEFNIKTNWRHVSGLGGLLALALVGFWAINAQVFGDTKDDVREIRMILQSLAKEDTTIRELMSGADVDLRSDISQTREIVARNEAALTFIRADMADLKTDFRSLRQDVTFLVQNTKK